MTKTLVKTVAAVGRELQSALDNEEIVKPSASAGLASRYSMPDAATCTSVLSPQRIQFESIGAGRYDAISFCGRTKKFVLRPSSRAASKEGNGTRDPAETTNTTGD